MFDLLKSRIPQDPVQRVKFWLTLCVCVACVLSVPVSLLSSQDWVLSQLREAHVIAVDPRTYEKLFWPAFWRFEAMALLTLTGTSFLVWVVLHNLLNAVSRVNDAARSMREGSFDNIHLQEDAPGQLQEVSRLLNDMAVSMHMEYSEGQRALGEISHELRTPLASIYGYAQLMNMEGLTLEQRQSYAQVIADESERLHRATDRVLRLSELQNRDRKLSNPGPVRVDEILRRVVAEAQSEGLLANDPEMRMDPLTVQMDEDVLLLSLRCLFDALLPEALAVAVQCAEAHDLAAVAVMVEQEKPANLPIAVRDTLEGALARNGGDIQEAVTAHIHAVQMTLGAAIHTDRK